MFEITVIATLAVLVPVVLIAAGPSILAIFHVERDRRHSAAATKLRSHARSSNVHLTRQESEELVRAPKP